MANRFWVLGTANWDGTTGISLNWSASSGGAGSATGPGTSDVAIFDAASGGGTVTVTGNITVQQITMGAFTGTLDFSANNNNVTLSTAFSGTGTGVRTLNMGNGVWTLSAASGTIWDMSVVTSFTFNANSSTIVASATSTGLRTFAGGAKTHNSISVVDGATPNTFFFGGGSTFTNLLITAPAIVVFTGGNTTTITNAFTWAGSAFNSTLTIQSSTTTAATIACASGSTMNWSALYRLTFTGNTPVASNSFDIKGNTNVTINGPSGGGGGGMRLAGHGGLAA